MSEVKAIYAGLVIIENKCIEIDSALKAQAPKTVQSSQSMPNDAQWQVVISLQRTLLHEQHNFFLAANHPSASPALNRVAAEYGDTRLRWQMQQFYFYISRLQEIHKRIPQLVEGPTRSCWDGLK